MLKKKTLGAALVCALALGASGAAFANVVTVDGITWDTSSPINLKVQGIDLRETSVSKVGDVLTGYGVIGSINGKTNFCSGCSLNFTFSYTVSDITGNKVVFDLGSLNLYADSSGSFNELDPTTAGPGTGNLWLSLVGHTSKYQDFPVTGQLFSTVTGSVSRPGTQSSGFGMLDATGGDAYEYIMKNIYADGLGGFADLTLSSSFSFQLPSSCNGTISSNVNSVCHYPIAGTGTLLNQMLPVATVPEPAELGMLGLGLGALGFFMWRRRKEGEGRA